MVNLKCLDKILWNISLVRKSKFEEEKKENKRLKKDLKHKNEIIEEKDKKLQEYPVIGPDTHLIDSVSHTYRYRELYKKHKKFPEKRQEYHEKLKVELVSMFKNTDAKKHFGYKYKGHDKIIYTIDKLLEDLEPEQILLYIKHDSIRDASVPHKVYEQVEEDRKKVILVPNIPDTIQINEFLIMEEIIGPSLFDFFYEKVPKILLPQEYKNRLVYLTAKDLLKHDAYFITTDFGFELEPSQCEQKLVDTFKEHFKLSNYDEKKIRALGSLLDNISHQPFPDVIFWNTKQMSKIAKLLLEKPYLDKEISMLNNEGLSHYDKYNLRKQTFLFDDFVQITDSYIMRKLNPRQKHELLQSLLDLLSRTIKDAKEDVKHIPIWRFYRNFRSDYWQNLGKIPAPKEEDKSHYLKMSYTGLYIYKHRRLPTEKDLVDVNPKKLLDSVLEIQT